MARGKRPLPGRLKILRGNPGKRPIPAEIQPTVGRPDCPAWLDVSGKKKWDELVPELERLGLLTVVDGDALAAYCQAWAEFSWATGRIRREGRVVDSPHGQRPNPAVAMQRSAWSHMRAFGEMFGLDPSSRAKLGGRNQDTKDDLEAFIGAG